MSPPFGYIPIIHHGIWQEMSVVQKSALRREHVSRETFYKKHRAETKRYEIVESVRLIQLSAVGEVFLEGTCPLSRRPQTAKSLVPMLLGTRRRWVRKATAFRGRSEQDRSALCAGCCAVILKTFRWNVFNGFSLVPKESGHDTPCPYEYIYQFQNVSRETKSPTQMFHVKHPSEALSE